MDTREAAHNSASRRAEGVAMHARSPWLYKKRCLFVEDEPRAAPEARILSDAGAYVVCAGTLSAARALFASERWDLVVLDVNVPDGQAHGFASELARRAPRPALLVVLGYLNAAESSSLQALGAIAVSKRDLGDQLVEIAAIALRSGELVGTSAFPGRFATKFGLTGRKQQVLSLLVEGLSQKEIASKLNVAESTARRHVQNVCDQCGVSTQRELLSLFSRVLMLEGRIP